MFPGLRWRLLLSYLTVMAAILSIFGAGVYVFFSRSMYSQMDKKLRTLAQAATPSFTQVKAKGRRYVNQVDTVPWRDIFNYDSQSLEWFDNQGKLLAKRGAINLEVPLKLSSWTFPNKQTGIPVRAYTVSVFTDSSLDRPEGFIRASQSLEEIDTIKNQLFWVLIFGGMSTLILIGLGGFWLTRKAIEPIEESFSKLKQFTADASHELRGPVTAIKASVDVMQCHPERIHPKDAKKLAAISSATTQMGQLIGDLLFLARTDNAAAAVPTRKRTKIALNKVLQDLVVLLEPMAHEKNITLKYQLMPNIYIFGDRADLNRLFSNLIQNALQYTPSGGKVNVSLSKHNRFAFVNVEDSGIGIAPEQIPFVFDRFWRADKARTRREGGTGLGLAIASAIAQNHGGKIIVTSQVNKGSCFQVRIPVLAEKVDV